MKSARAITRWLPIAILAAAALAYEPLRSGFSMAGQSCELTTDWQRMTAAFFNLRHIIAYGVLFLVAAATLHQNRIAKAAMAVFLFSAVLEVMQSFFSTGNCRLWDLIPNLIGIGLAAVIFSIGASCLKRLRHPIC